MRAPWCWFAVALAASGCAPAEAPLVEEDVDVLEASATGVARRFDLATLNCASADPDEACDPADDKCFCHEHFEHLNTPRPHFLVVASDARKAEIHAAGNLQAAYVDRLNDGYGQISGSARADQVLDDAAAAFPSGVPKWFFVNEISAGSWPDDAAYRAWVIAFAKRMRARGREVIVAAPFDRPGHHASDWSALADAAHVAAEVYLTGAAVNASGNSVSFCEGRYRDAAEAYGALGVPLERLFLVEHFGGTAKGATWGRAGVGVPGWKNAIHARAKAARKIGFAGFVSYSWAGNQMHDPDATRLSFEDTYASEVLP